MTPEVHDSQAERTELAKVLASEFFTRSPIVAQMLKYICNRHFTGQSHEVKEYNIAVEAFGRPESFDPTRDSIVRVEAHRLRKRLQEYYHGPGAGHEIQIVLPPGNYVPQFVRRPPEPVADAPSPEVAAPSAEIRAIPVAANMGNGVEHSAEAAVAASLPAPAVIQDPGRKLSRYAVIFVAVAAVLTGSFFWARTTRQKSAQFALAARAAIVPDPLHSAEEEVRILAGSNTSKLVDHYGNTWSGDRYYEGGTARTVPPRPIAYAQDPVIFQHFRQGDCSYSIPLKKGIYELKLYFAETVWGENNVGGGGETTRVFRIQANGKDLLPFLDVVGDAGGSNTADIKVFKDVQPADDGMLHLAFLTVNNEVPFVNAIEIVPSRPGAIRPIRILARDAGYTDADNRLWSADRYFHNGLNVQRHDPVTNTNEETLYQNEHFGNFSYAIPVAMNGSYTVTMKFCEAWFGKDRPAAGGLGERVFNISFNGRMLLENFDVFKEAGSLRALDKTFKGMQPNAQGKLIFAFTPILNYAMVDAIEVVDEAWK